MPRKPVVWEDYFSNVRSVSTGVRPPEALAAPFSSLTPGDSAKFESPGKATTYGRNINVSSIGDAMSREEGTQVEEINLNFRYGFMSNIGRPPHEEGDDIKTYYSHVYQGQAELDATIAHVAKLKDFSFSASEEDSDKKKLTIQARDRKSVV